MDEPIHIRYQVSFAEVTSADFHLKKYRFTKRSGRAKVTLILRLVGNVCIFDHLGKPKTFSSDCLVTENQKSLANAAIF